MRVLLKSFLWFTFTILMVSLTNGGSTPSAIAQTTSCADLIVTDITFVPAQPLKGQNSVVNVIVKNQGSCSTLAFGVQWKPNLLAAPLSAQTSGLGPGASRSVSFNYVFPNAGNFISTAIVDSSQNVNETNEFNNNILKPVTVLQAGIDLVITGFTLNPVEPVQGRVAQATITVQNLGNSPAGEFVVQWKPTLLTADLSTQINGLEPGASTSVSFDYTYFLTGDFLTLATVDGTRRVLETNEFNNSESMILTVQPPRPDLVITSLTISPSQPIEDIPATVTVVVENQGNTPAEEFLVQWKPTLLASGQTKQVNGLGVGQSIAVNLDYTYLFPGEFFSIAEVDSTHKVLELDETNNWSTLLVTVQKGGADLLITSLSISPAQPVEDIPAMVTVVVENQGNIPAEEFMVQWKPTPLASDQAKQVNGLGVGQSVAVNFNYTYPFPGEFLGVAEVDSTHRILELDETNNWSTLLVTVQKATVDLLITSLSISPAQPTQGAPATVSVTVNNQGNSPAGPFFVHWNPDLLGLITPGPATLSKQVDGLGVGASTVVNFTFTYPNQGNFLTIATVDVFNNIPETDDTNNSETLNVAVQPGIDLVITNFFISPASPVRQSKATANITVKNQNIFPAGPFWVQWKPNKEGLGSPMIRVDGLDPGASTTVLIDGSYSQAGDFVSIAVVDAFNQVIESNEANNNSNDVSVTVQQRTTLVDVRFTQVQVFAPFEDGSDGDGEWEMLFIVMDDDGACNVTLDFGVATKDINGEGLQCRRHRQNNVGRDSGEVMNFDPGVFFSNVLLIEAAPLTLGALAFEVDSDDLPVDAGMALTRLAPQAGAGKRIQGSGGDCSTGRCYDLIFTVSNVREPPPIFPATSAEQPPPDFVVLPTALSQLIPIDAELPDGILRMHFQYLPLIMR